MTFGSIIVEKPASPGFSSACKITVCPKLTWFFIRKQCGKRRDSSSSRIENNSARGHVWNETCAETKKCTYSYMEIVRGKRGRQEEENETECSVALQGNRASNSRTCRKTEHFPCPSYLRQLTIVTSTNYVSEIRHFIADITNVFI